MARTRQTARSASSGARAKRSSLQEDEYGEVRRRSFRRILHWRRGQLGPDEPGHVESVPIAPLSGALPTRVVSEIIGMLPHDVARKAFAPVCCEWNEIVRSKHPCFAFGPTPDFVQFLEENTGDEVHEGLRLSAAPQLLEPHMPLISGEASGKCFIDGAFRGNYNLTLRVRASAEQLAAFASGGLADSAPGGTVCDFFPLARDDTTVILSVILAKPGQRFVMQLAVEDGEEAQLWMLEQSGLIEGPWRLRFEHESVEHEAGTMEDMLSRLATVFETKTGVALADARSGAARPQENKFSWLMREDAAGAPASAAGTPAPGDELPSANIDVYEYFCRATPKPEIASVTVLSVDEDGSAELQVVVNDFNISDLGDQAALVVSSDLHDSEWEMSMKIVNPEGVCFADGDVPSDLVEALQSGVDKLAARPDKDYHPGSDNVVLDHVHPALYPFIKGTSEFVPSDDLKNEDASGDPRESVDGANELINEPNSGRWGRAYEDSIYQWLPTYFDISVTGKVSIRGDINNLRPRDEHQGLYESLGLLFEQFVPELEAVLSYADLVTFPDENFDPYNSPSKGDPWHRHVEIQHRLAGQAVQVIPKIVDYELQPGQSYEGVWHVEGMSHENIIATCLYILDRDDAIEGGHLLFKRAFTCAEAHSLAEGFSKEDCNLPTRRFINDGMVPLGQVQTPRGRRVVFPNSHVHRVAKMTNTGSALSRRRIIAFFVVDPLVRIVSTQECPDQRGKLSLEAAKEHRLELMRERRLHKQDWNVRDLNLCEH